MTAETMNTDGQAWTDPGCPTARAVDLIGDRWILLIVRDAMDGASSFTDFQQRTGIAKNILTERLRRLVERGVLDRQTAATGKRQLYALTPAGRDLFMVIVALRQWGERHAFRPGEEHSTLVDSSGLPLPTAWPVGADGAFADDQSTSVVTTRQHG